MSSQSILSISIDPEAEATRIVQFGKRSQYTEASRRCGRVDR